LRRAAPPPPGDARPAGRPRPPPPRRHAAQHRVSEPPLELSIDGGALEWARIDAALEEGEIDEGEWFRRCQAVIVPAYLSSDDPRRQSGKNGDEAAWQESRRPIVEALDRNGSFLDVGCANGYLMESIA